MCLGIPGQIVEFTDAANQLAAVIVSGTRRTVQMGLLPPEEVAPGRWVLVHAGFALAAIDEQEARETLALLQAMSEAFAGEPASGYPAGRERRAGHAGSGRSAGRASGTRSAS